MDTSNSSVWTRVLMLLFSGSELTGIIYDARWLLLLCLLLVAADFRYGWGESQKRYAEAATEDDKEGMEKYRWHKSRAIRRTCNKAMDYLMLVTVGVFVGTALLQPMGYPRIWGGVAATGIVALCEGISIIGHFLYLRGVVLEHTTLMSVIKGIAIAIVKSRSPEIGEGLERGLDEAEKERNKSE